MKTLQTESYYTGKVFNFYGGHSIWINREKRIFIKISSVNKCQSLGAARDEPAVVITLACKGLSSLGNPKERALMPDRSRLGPL